LAKEQEKKKGDLSLNKIHHPKTQNTKQVAQGNGQKIQKNTKLRSSFRTLC
jgi:hypothetical protein